MPIIMFYRFDAAEMLRLTEKWHGSFTVAAITVFIALMNHPDIETRDLSSMKKMFSGGAPVAPSIVESFEALTGAYIHNIYGLTETTSPSHATPLGGRALVDPGSGALAVGVPIPNTICRIVDVASGQDLPAGEVGELIIKGPQVVAGYCRSRKRLCTRFVMAIFTLAMSLRWMQRVGSTSLTVRRI